MKDKKCDDCMEYKRCRDSYASWIFFIIGLIATVAIRLVAVLMNVNAVYAKAAWYVGVSGFFVFFIFKFKVNQTRARLINRRDLVDKIHHERQLTKEDYSLVGAILCAL